MPPIIQSVRAQNEGGTNLSAGYVSVNEPYLHYTGIRGRSLLVLLTVIAICWLLAVVTLLCNVLLLTRLGLGPQGMASIQLLDDGIVQFTTDVAMETVITDGNVRGYADKGILVEGSDVSLKAGGVKFQVNNGADSSDNSTSFIAIMGIEDVLLRNKHHEINFEALYPRFKLPKEGIHDLKTKSVSTASVMAPMDESLTLNVSSINFKGNEKNTFWAGKRTNITARGSILLKTSLDGLISLDAHAGVILGNLEALPISPSPALSADVLGRRLCACRNGHLFTVEGNAECKMDAALCY